MRKRKVAWLIAICSVPLILATVFWEEIVEELIMPDVKEFRIAEMAFDGDSARVKFTLSVFNRGLWRMDVLHTHLQFYDDTVLLLDYRNDSIKTIARNQFKTEALYLTIPLKKIVDRIQMHQGKDSTRITVRGTVSFVSVFGEMSAPVDQVYMVRVPVPPRISVRQIDYLGKEDRVYAWLMHVTLNNQNPRELVMKNVSYEMVSPDLFSMKGYLADVKVQAMDSTSIDVPMKMDIVNKFGLISAIVLDKDKVDYSFVLRGTVMELTGIVHDSVPVTVHTYGRVELYDAKRANVPRINFSKRNK